jgi:ABC-type cobalamin transport system permease subunit
MRHEVEQPREMTPEQRKRAIISGLLLAGVALGIYAVVIMKFFVYNS